MSFKTAMDSIRERPYLVVIIAAIAGLATRLIDSFISNEVITGGQADKTIAACAYLTLGGWVGVATFVIVAKLAGRSIVDEHYRGFALGGAVMQKHAVFSGLTAALSTGFYLVALQTYDAAIVAALRASQVIWVICYKHFCYRDKTPASVVLGPAALMVLGIAISNFSLAISAQVLLLVFLLSAPLGAVSEVEDEMAATASNATLTTIWRFVYLSTFGTVLSLLYAMYSGKFALYLMLLAERASEALPYLIGLMFFVFFANGLRARAKVHPKMDTSEVMIISNLEVVALLVVVLVCQLGFGINSFGKVEVEPLRLLLKIVGAIVITGSVIKLTQNKSHFMRRR